MLSRFLNNALIFLISKTFDSLNTFYSCSYLSVFFWTNDIKLFHDHVNCELTFSLLLHNLLVLLRLIKLWQYFAFPHLVQVLFGISRVKYWIRTYWLCPCAINWIFATFGIIWLYPKMHRTLTIYPDKFQFIKINWKLSGEFC